MHRILIPTRLAQEGVAHLTNAPGFKVDFRPGLKGDALRKAIAKADAVIIRSDNRMDRPTIKAATRLRIIGRAGVGVENVDLQAASERGIVVLNTPAANSIAVAELTMAMMLTLSRKIVAADRSVKAGRWEKSAFAGHELNGKTLGLVGFGRIGREVARRAASFGMNVVAFDPFVTEAAAAVAGVKLAKLPDLIRTADVISLHLPLNDKTRGLIGKTQLGKMKSSALLINASRGGIVDENALQQALKSKQLAGCALDVFETEPPTNRWFAEMENVVVTPHLGASTEESQTKVALEITESVRLALAEGIYVSPVNVPIADPSRLPEVLPFIGLAEKLGVLLRSLEDGPCGAITVELGAKSIGESRVIQASILKGVLSGETDAPITLVNSPMVAAERHIRLAVVDHSSQANEAATIAVVGKFGRRTRRVAGLVDPGRVGRIRSIDDFAIDLIPDGRALIFTNQDRPGVIGAVGGILGEAQINIAAWLLGRKKRGGTALGVVTIDDLVPGPIVKQLSSLPHMGRVVQVDWGESG
jgi:D-3-phosphoglycerate dehydrogenase